MHNCISTLLHKNMVSKKCCVPGCGESAASKFGVPKNLYSVWDSIIGCPLNRTSRVCANHFKPSDIISTWASGEGSSHISVCTIQVMNTYVISWFLVSTIQISNFIKILKYLNSSILAY